jgi:hypothetical protein
MLTFQLKIAQRGKYKHQFECNKLKLIIINVLREAPADDEKIAMYIMAVNGWAMYETNCLKVCTTITRETHAWCKT